MNDLARQKLIKLVDTQPPGLMEDSERFEAFLRDYCGECKPEISAILAALAEDVPRDLRRMRSQPYPLLREQLANKLQDERSIHQEAALWAVESWAMALEIAPGSQRQHGAALAMPAEEDLMTRSARKQAPPPPPPPPRPIASPQIVSPNTPSPNVVLPNVVPPQAPPVVVYPRNKAAGGVSPARPSQPQPTWQTPQWIPPGNVSPPQGFVQPWAPPAILPAPPNHNSLLAGGACFAAAIIFGLLAGGARSNASETFYGLFVFAFALMGAVELVLGLVRLFLKNPQPPGFVAASLSFWMKLFAAEDRVLSVIAKKQNAQFPAAAPMTFPAPVAPPAFSQAQSAGPQPSNIPPPPAPPRPAERPSGGQAPPAERVFCIACGATNGEGAVFCLSCGERLYYPGAQQTLPPN
jgi:hypothetical protein